MNRMAPIAFITDFGTRDWFVPVMKAVVMGIDQSVRIVDITHNIAPGDVRSAAFVLKQSYAWFPSGSVFCVVVDPGVGGPRAALACKAADRFFVGPDNGVLSYALSAQGDAVVRRIENRAFMLPSVSATFHGRDVFAPAAAHVARGAAVEDMGPAADGYVSLAWPEVRVGESAIDGEVVYVDGFGNAFTNITAAHLGTLPDATRALHVEGLAPIPLCTHYAQRARGEPLCLLNASGYLEIALNGAPAATCFTLGPQTPVRLSVQK